MLQYRPSSRIALAFALGLMLSSACKGSVEDLPDNPPVDDDWIDAIEDEDEVAGEVPATPPAGEVPATPPAAGDTQGVAAADAPVGEAGVPPEGTAPEAGGTVVAAADKPAGGNASGHAGNGGAAAPAEAAPAEGVAAEGVPAEGVPAEGVPGEAAPVEAAPAEVAPTPEPEPPKPAPITMADYTGTFRFTGGAAQKQDLTDAIEAAAQQVAGIIRGIARKRLSKTQILETPITIKVSGSQVSFSLGTTGGSWSAEIDGPTTTMKYNGDKYKVKVRSKDGKMITTFMAPDATKTIVYVLSNDRKRLTVHHRLVADQLDTPVTFKFSYARN